MKLHLWAVPLTAATALAMSCSSSETTNPHGTTTTTHATGGGGNGGAGGGTGNVGGAQAGSGGVGGHTAGGAGGAGGQGGGGACPPNPNDDACTQCMKESCCDAALTCFADAECSTCYDCLTTSPNPANCFNGDCNYADTETQAFLTCSSEHCGQLCQGGG